MGVETLPLLIFKENFMNECHCPRWLSVQGIVVAADELQITVAQETLVDGRWYNVRLPEALPALAGTETVFIYNGAGGTAIQICDWRGRQVLSERVLKGGARLRMIYTKNGLNDLPTFQAYEGLARLP